MVLRFFEGRSPQEISELLGRPASTVRVQLMRAVSALRIKLTAKRGAWLRAGWLALRYPFLGRRAAFAIPATLALGLLATVFWWSAQDVPSEPEGLSVARLEAEALVPVETEAEPSARAGVVPNPPLFDTMSVAGRVVADEIELKLRKGGNAQRLELRVGYGPVGGN